ncbi:MAG: hypothetical protein ACWGQW_15800 [bacterium]
MGKTKGKSAKKDGIVKHQKQEQAKKRAAKERRHVELPEEYKKK